MARRTACAKGSGSALRRAAARSELTGHHGLVRTTGHGSPCTIDPIRSTKPTARLGGTQGTRHPVPESRHRSVLKGRDVRKSSPPPAMVAGFSYGLVVMAVARNFHAEKLPAILNKYRFTCRIQAAIISPEPKPQEPSMIATPARMPTLSLEIVIDLIKATPLAVLLRAIRIGARP
jgi:hypothetical protein